jgi:hypothetical protein
VIGAIANVMFVVCATAMFVVGAMLPLRTARRRKYEVHRDGRARPSYIGTFYGALGQPFAKCWWLDSMTRASPQHEAQYRPVKSKRYLPGCYSEDGSRVRRGTGVFHAVCGISATISSFFTEATMQDEFSVSPGQHRGAA